MAISYRNGQFVYEGDALARMRELMRRVGQSSDKSVHEMFANVIIPPIKQIADYTEWTKMFYREYPVDLNALPRIAVDNPSMVAFYTSPTGEAMFVRPGRTTYVTPSLVMIDAGLEIGWDDMAMAGWPILEQKIKEVGEELARKRDTEGASCLDTALATVSGHSTSVSGGAMTKASVDAVLELAATDKWKLDRVVLHPATFMDMTNWVWSNATHLWQNIVKDAELLRNGAVADYGGCTWYTFAECPTNTVYMGCSPEVSGAYRWTAGGLRTASDIDIKKKTDLHMWDQKLGHYWGNPYALYGITITA